MILDTHVHFWDYNPVRDTWIDKTMEAIRRDFTPADLRKASHGLSVEGFVAVQADPSVAETEFLLRLATNHPEIKGVVGWLDLCSPILGEHLELYTMNPALKGLRHIVQAEAPGYMDRPEFRRGIAALESYGLTYDILIYAPQLDEACRLVTDFPGQAFVLDHLGKPNVREGRFAEWRAGLEKLAEAPNCCCKLSGLVTEALWDRWTAEELRPYLETALELFGPKRLLFGSDWPVCQLAASYEQVLGLVLEFIKTLSTDEQRQILRENARSFYRLN